MEILKKKNQLKLLSKKEKKLSTILNDKNKASPAHMQARARTHTHTHTHSRVVQGTPVVQLRSAVGKEKKS